MENKKMKISNLFTKTRKNITEESGALSYELLVRAGFINKEIAGVYSLLPLGTRVLRKIESIIRDEMNAIGGQEIVMPSLQPKDNWIRTGRWDSVDVLYKLKSRWGNNEYALGPTHEEIVFPLVGKYISSYKDLPISVYQIQTKFRDEKRAKSGIIRGREFGMKDMYSFHETHQDLNEFYEKVKLAYLKIFQKCGIDAKVTKASGGDFTDKYSHEFMALSDAGEDQIVSCISCNYAENKEVSSIEPGDLCPVCKNKTELRKAIEIGNIFDLEQKFSKDFNIFFTDKEGERHHPFSGCYGIGTTRLIGAIVETNHDDKGIIWPKEVTPYDLYLIGLDIKKNKKRVDEVYQKLTSLGYSVLFDDREDSSPGLKFNDADLIGIPYQIIVGGKKSKEGELELKLRDNGNSRIIKEENIEKELKI